MLRQDIGANRGGITTCKVGLAEGVRRPKRARLKTAQSVTQVHTADQPTRVALGCSRTDSLTSGWFGYPLPSCWGGGADEQTVDVLPMGNLQSLDSLGTTHHRLEGMSASSKATSSGGSLSGASRDFFRRSRRGPARDFTQLAGRRLETKLTGRSRVPPPRPPI